MKEKKFFKTQIYLRTMILWNKQKKIQWHGKKKLPGLKLKRIQNWKNKIK